MTAQRRRIAENVNAPQESGGDTAPGPPALRRLRASRALGPRFELVAPAARPAAARDRRARSRPRGRGRTSCRCPPSMARCRNGEQVLAQRVDGTRRAEAVSSDSRRPGRLRDGPQRLHLPLATAPPLAARRCLGRKSAVRFERIDERRRAPPDGARARGRKLLADDDLRQPRKSCRMAGATADCPTMSCTRASPDRASSTPPSRRGYRACCGDQRAHTCGARAARWFMWTTRLRRGHGGLLAFRSLRSQCRMLKPGHGYVSRWRW